MKGRNQNHTVTELLNHFRTHQDECPYDNGDTCPGAGYSRGKGLCAKCYADYCITEKLAEQKYDMSRPGGSTRPPNINLSAPGPLTDSLCQCEDCGSCLTMGETPSGIERAYCPGCAGEGFQRADAW